MYVSVSFADMTKDIIRYTVYHKMYYQFVEFSRIKASTIPNYQFCLTIKLKCWYGFGIIVKGNGQET